MRRGSVVEVNTGRPVVGPVRDGFMLTTPDGRRKTIFFFDRGLSAVQHANIVVCLCMDYLASIGSPYIVVEDHDGRVAFRLLPVSTMSAVEAVLKDAPPELLADPCTRVYMSKEQYIELQHEAAGTTRRVNYMGACKSVFGIPVIVQDTPDGIVLTITAPGFPLFDCARVLTENTQYPAYYSGRRPAPLPRPIRIGIVEVPR